MSNEYKEIRKGEHRGIGYTVMFNGNKNAFEVLCQVSKTLEGNDVVELEKQVVEAIDEWSDRNPTDFDGWYELFSDCMEWAGYEDCELNREQLKDVAVRYAKSLKTRGEL